MRSICAFFALILTGCAGAGGLPPPAGRLMQTPAKLADVEPGQDLVHVLADTRGKYGQCTSRLKGLQRYVHAAAQ